MLSAMAAIAPMLMPLPNSRSMPGGSALATSGYDVTHSASAMLVVTMIRLRWSVKSTLPRVWMPTTATVANRVSAAPPSTGLGIDDTMAATFGRKPSRIMMTPAAATTQRLLTPVSRTRPTFSENAV